jgi:hypothetical protein
MDTGVDETGTFEQLHHCIGLAVAYLADKPTSGSQPGQRLVDKLGHDAQAIAPRKHRVVRLVIEDIAPNEMGLGFRNVGRVAHDDVEVASHRPGERLEKAPAQNFDVEVQTCPVVPRVAQGLR